MEEYGDPNGEHLKVKFGGVVIQGSPVGGNGYRSAELGKIINILHTVNTLIEEAPSLQIRAGLHQMCGGENVINHVMRTQPAHIWDMAMANTTCIERVEKWLDEANNSIIGDAEMGEFH